MAHHGPKPWNDQDMEEITDDDRRDAFRQLMSDQFGPTGKFPQGKIAPGDEGEIAFGVGHSFREVVINFNAPVAWLGLTPEQAEALAAALIGHARDARLIGNKTPETKVTAGKNKTSSNGTTEK